MATLTVFATNRTLTDLSAQAVAADVGLSDKWTGTGLEMVYIENGGGGSITVTLTRGLGGTIDGTALPALTVVIAAGKRTIIGPLATGMYNDVNSFTSIAYSAVTTVKVLPFKLGT